MDKVQKPSNSEIFSCSGEVANTHIYIHEFFKLLIDILEQLVQKDRYIILVGDLNINTLEDG
jgi:exonuclease III